MEDLGSLVGDLENYIDTVFSYIQKIYHCGAKEPDNNTKKISNEYYEKLTFEYNKLTNQIQEFQVPNVFGDATPLFKNALDQLGMINTYLGDVNYCVGKASMTLQGRTYGQHDWSWEYFCNTGVKDLFDLHGKVSVCCDQVADLLYQNFEDFKTNVLNQTLNYIQEIDDVVGAAEDIKYFVNNLVAARKSQNHQLYQKTLKEMQDSKANLPSRQNAITALKNLDFTSNKDDMRSLFRQSLVKDNKVKLLMQQTTDIAKDLGPIIGDYINTIDECLDDIINTTRQKEFNEGHAIKLQARVKKCLNDRQVNRTSKLDQSIDKLSQLWDKQRNIIRFD